MISLIIAKKFIIKGDNKETLSLLLFMGLLKPDGVCGVVLIEGVFFAKKFMKLRKVLCDNYNVTNIISIPKDDFLNTHVQTSVLIFHNNGQTEKIIFSEIKYIMDENNSKFDIYEIHPVTKEKGVFLEVDYKDIVKNEYTLNYMDYWREEITLKKDVKSVKLEDIVKF